MDKIFDAIGVFFGNFLYNLFSVIFPIIQGVQNLFFMFAGIQDGIQIDGVPITNTNLGNTEGTDSGIVYYLFQQSLVRNLLISIMVLAVFLMIVFTIMAFIKNAYVAKQKSWKEIIGKAIIGLANFVLLPACCLLGVWLGNILLQAVNGATSSAGVTRMDKKLFISCAYDANKYRTGEASGPELAKKAYTLINGTEEGFDEINIEEGKENEYYADIVDQIFQSDSVSVFGANDVHEYYNTWKVHFIILVVAGIFMLYVLGSLAFSMIRRMFILLMLYIISPALCAMYPLDDGAAVGNWKKEFVKQTISAYGAVAGLNIFFALIPVIDQIGQVGAGGFLDNVLQLFILVSGLFIVKEFISLISGYIGAEDSYAKGTGLLGSAGKKVAGAFGTVALGTTAVATRSIAASMSAKKGERGKALASSLWDSTKSGLSKVSDKVKTATGGSVDIGGTIKTVKDSSKAGKSFLAEKQT